MASFGICHGDPSPSWLQFGILPSLHHLETVACVTPYFSANSRVLIASLIYVVLKLMHSNIMLKVLIRLCLLAVHRTLPAAHLVAVCKFRAATV